MAIAGGIALLLFAFASLVSSAIIITRDRGTLVEDAGDIFVKAVAVGEYADRRLQAAANGNELPAPPELIADLQSLTIGLVTTLGFEVSLFLLVGIATGLAPGDLWQRLGLRGYRLSGIWRPVMAWPLAYLGIAIYSYLASLTGIAFLEPDGTVPQAITRDDTTFALATVLAVIAAPVSEELFFRGFVFSGLARRGFWFAAAISSLAFTVVHFDPGSLIPFFWVGVLLSWLYWSRGSLWDAIIFHALFNFTSIALLASTR